MPSSPAGKPANISYTINGAQETIIYLTVTAYSYVATKILGVSTLGFSTLKNWSGGGVGWVIERALRDPLCVFTDMVRSLATCSQGIHQLSPKKQIMFHPNFLLDSFFPH